MSTVLELALDADAFNFLRGLGLLADLVTLAKAPAAPMGQEVASP